MKLLLLCFLIAIDLLAANSNPQLKQPLTLSTEILLGLLNIDSKINSFVPISFRESIEKNQSGDLGVLIAEQNFANFCEDKTQTGLYPSFSIPKIIHVIWLGSSPPSTVEIALASWKKYHPTWEVKLWTDKEVEVFSWSQPRSALFFASAKNWAEKSDILRFEILYQFGGIYSDTDVICLKSFEDLVASNLNFFASFEERQAQFCFGRLLVGSALVGAAKNNPIIKQCLNLHLTYEEAPGVVQYIRSGPGPLSQACYAALEEGQKNMLILPFSYFYPLPWKKRLGSLEEIQSFIKPESFAIHLWEGSYF